VSISAKSVMTKIASKSSVLHAVEGEDCENLKRCLTRMVEDLQSACFSNGIDFCFCYGSALGAHRHQGFIPWDDDVDIAMLREDWECFKEKFETLLGDRYVLEGPGYGNKDTKVAWGKIYLKNSLLLEIQDVNVPYEKGVFVDVFIIDGLSDNKIVRFFDRKIAKFMKGVATSMVYYKYPNDMMETYMAVSKTSWVYFKLRKFLGFSFSFISHKRWCEMYDKFISRHRKSKYTIMDYNDGIRLRSDWKPFDKAQFNGLTVNVPKDNSRYLRDLFGPTFMELPPEDKRERHFVVEMQIPDVMNA